MSSAHEEGSVAEVQGLYGPVSIGELLVQKLWYRQEFNRHRLRTAAGEPLRIIHPGRWNRLGGPDFLGAEWEIGERRQLGDVEIHFYQRDWFAHGHGQNPAFAGVGLHVLVFDPDPDERRAVTASGRTPEVLVLAPHLEASLEEFAWRDALRLLDGSDPLDLAAPLLELPVAARRQQLATGADRRWGQKVFFARRRLAEAGWTAACHQIALEVLGFRANRAPMGELALRYPLSAWHQAGPDWIEQRLREFSWRRQGLRPASQPRRRLEQYRQLVAHEPQWPERLASLLATFTGDGERAESAAAFRQRHLLAAWRRELRDTVLGGAIPSPRLDTLVVDGLLPLAAAEWGADRFAAGWHHWYPGDLPDRLRLFLRAAGVTDRLHPLSNGLQQGALQTLHSRDEA